MTPGRHPFDSARYWIGRHEEFTGSHEATGLLGSSPRTNSILYELRKRALLASLRTRNLQGARVLDAGCGLGDFSRLYRDLGAQVFGCDVSPLAVQHCREQGLGVFERGRIADVPQLFPGPRFDVVHCFDVLYHLVDPKEWRESILALDSVSTGSACWFITEIVRARGQAPHIQFRGRAAYDQELAKYQRRIEAERRLHWLMSASPRLFSHFPGLSLPLEPLSRWGPTRAWAFSALWTIGRDAT